MRRFTSSKRTCFILLAAVAAGFLGLGCGDDDGDNDVTVKTGTLSKARFIKQADAICRQSEDEIQTRLRAFLSRNRGGPSPQKDPSRAAAIIEAVVIPVYENQIERISSLGVPSGDEDNVAAILESMQQSLDESIDNDPRRFLFSEDPFADAARMAGSYGLVVCARV